MDSSGSVGARNFKTTLRFVSSFVDSFDIGPKRVQVGVTSFDSIVMPKIKLNQIYNKQSLKNAINNIRYHGGGTSTDKALAYARNSGFSPQNGGRKNVTQVRNLTYSRFYIFNFHLSLFRIFCLYVETLSPMLFKSRVRIL